MNTAMRYIRHGIVCLFIGFSLASCGTADRQRIEIPDVRQPHYIALHHPGRGGVSSLFIKGTGILDGSATISLLLDGEVYKTEVLVGAVSFTWNDDWYSQDAELVYKPLRVKSGTFALRYKFSEL